MFYFRRGRAFSPEVRCGGGFGLAQVELNWLASGKAQTAWERALGTRSVVGILRAGCRVLAALEPTGYRLSGSCAGCRLHIENDSEGRRPGRVTHLLDAARKRRVSSRSWQIILSQQYLRGIYSLLACPLAASRIAPSALLWGNLPLA